MASRNTTKASNAKKVTVALIAFFALIAMSSSMIVRGSLNGNDDAQTQPPAPTNSFTTIASMGAPLPSFSLNNIDGETFSTDSLAGKPAWIIFSETWCPPCKVQMQTVQEMSEKYGPEGLHVLTVFLDEDQKTVSEYMKAAGYTFEALLDPGSVVAHEGFGAMGTPTNVFVDADGTILYLQAGMLEADRIEAAVKLLLSGEAQ